ncbi:hypothetical protein [Pasteuria penetrans]|uniref:hypothetical protein n=1 Tax=Pasteuria penetrans TaxID=86005 RepID=UPI00165C389F|nr:hypothetical protein [Pasteuria penetrans]
MSVRQSPVVPYEGLRQVHSLCAPDAARTVGGSPSMAFFSPGIGSLFRHRLRLSVFSPNDSLYSSSRFTPDRILSSCLFPERSPPLLFTTAALDGLKPTGRFRGTLPPSPIEYDATHKTRRDPKLWRKVYRT